MFHRWSPIFKDWGKLTFVWNYDYMVLQKSGYNSKDKHYFTELLNTLNVRNVRNPQKNVFRKL